MSTLTDKLNWDVAWDVQKWSYDHLTSTQAFREAEQGFSGDELIRMGVMPDDGIAGRGNLLLNAGIALLEDLLIGAGGTAYDNSNAYIGVGESSTAASASQTGLQGSSTTFKAMDVSYPSRSSQTVTWRSTFGSSDANNAWEEWTIVNASSDSGVNLNRKVTSMGTKVSGATWTLSVTVTIS